MVCVVMLIKMEALGVEVPETVHRFLIAAFIESVKDGEVQL
jgi:hypothetical protein